jgi:vancomycin permeability regulator SanA
MRKAFLIFLWLLLLLPMSIILNYFVFNLVTYSAITNEVDELKSYHRVLILGAGNSPLGEWQNTTFSNRLNTCLYLYDKLKITQIVCSGKIKEPFYHEASDMRDFLLKKGVESQCIVMDSLGTSTLKSVENYATKYAGDSVLIISQRLHLPRVLIAAHCRGLHAIGFSAGEYTPMSYKVYFYEALARMKMNYDLLFK